MIVSLDGAKKLWCPFVRFFDIHRTMHDSRSNFPTGKVEERNRCIGDECACWRWDSHVKGYCGLGGHGTKSETREI